MPDRRIALLLRLGLAQSARELIGAGRGTRAAGVALQKLDDLVDLVALDQLGYRLQVAVAAADERDLLDGVAVEEVVRIRTGERGEAAL